MPTDDPTFDAAATAFAQVQTTVTQLKTEYASVCAQIADTQDQLTAAPLAYVPLADLQAAILDFIDASGAKYGQNEIVGTISNFAQNRMTGNRNDPALAGKPMRYCDLQSAIDGGGFLQLLTPYKTVFNDQVFYCLFAQLVKQTLQSLMATMPPSAFGYDKISPDQIGSDRATRQASIATLNTQLAALQAQKSDLASKLAALGVRVPS